MKFTNKRIDEFSAKAHLYLTDKERYPKQTLFGKGLARLLKRTESARRDMLERLEEINDEHCLKDLKDQSFVLNEKGERKFTKEGWDKVKAERKVMFDTEVEVKPLIASFVPANLRYDEIEAFSGFIIKPTEDDGAEWFDSDETPDDNPG